MRLTKSVLVDKDDNLFTPLRPPRGGASEYRILYNQDGVGYAFTRKEMHTALLRFGSMDEGDPNFPHRWTFLRWITNLIN